MDGPVITSSATLVEFGRWVGAQVWLSRRLFELLGGWVRSVAEPEAKLLLGSQALRHAWHAELWSSLLPEIAGADPEDLVAPSGRLQTDLVASLARIDGDDRTLERLVAVHRVTLPQMVAEYTEIADADPGPAGAPLRRVTRLVLVDLQDDIDRGEAVLGGLIATEVDVRRAAEVRAELERHTVEIDNDR